MNNEYEPLIRLKCKFVKMLSLTRIYKHLQHRPPDRRQRASRWYCGVTCCSISRPPTCPTSGSSMTANRSRPPALLVCFCFTLTTLHIYNSFTIYSFYTVFSTFISFLFSLLFLCCVLCDYTIHIYTNTLYKYCLYFSRIDFIIRFLFLILRVLHFWVKKLSYVFS